jgi:hypothetical protein
MCVCVWPGAQHYKYFRTVNIITCNILRTGNNLYCKRGSMQATNTRETSKVLDIVTYDISCNINIIFVFI